MKFSLGNTFKMLFVFGVAVIASERLSAQSLGDYRSVSSGNWTNVSIWQVYNGSSWIAATSYPGQLVGTNDVYIQGGYSVTISSNIPNAVNSLTVGDGSGSTDNFYIGSTSSLQTQLITIADGGLAEWTSNVSFSLPSGAAFVIDSGGTLATDNPCNSAKRLIIGSTVYSTCNGGAGTDYSFDDLNDSGGSISVSASSNSPICDNETLNLYSNPSGAGSSGATYNWTATAGPVGYTFSSTDENPVVTNLSAGSYTFSVTISDGSVSNTDSVDVTVNSSPTIVLQPTDQAVASGNNGNFSVTATGADTYQWQVSTDGGSIFSSIADGSEYSGSQTSNLTVISPDPSKSGNIYRVLLSNSTNSCSPTTSDEVTLTIQTGTVITNRKITFRVNQN
ncbi:MAG: PKD domain-containing protein [Allomuricauda sp.]|uniref:PKD domain-containing protein n=1 Tax=Flagellimonas profundi TaxID=2915620 RepID=A0ABS3FHP6_9FLAO|nr:hypothetical protein [Allomuricauda profundi]MBO0342578.1 hypothetical protein [Allomuricauda profundi]